MPILRHPRPELVAQALAAGKKPAEASADAGYPQGSSFGSNARKRAQRKDIKDRKEEILARQAARAEALKPQVHPSDIVNIEYIAAKLTQQLTRLTSQLPSVVVDPELIARIVGDLRSLLVALEQTQASDAPLFSPRPSAVDDGTSCEGDLL